MRTADGSEANVFEEVHKVLINVGGMTHAFTVLVVRDALSSMIIEKQGLKNIRAP